MQTNNKINTAIEFLAEGPAALEQLEALLKIMDLDERRALAQAVERADLQAPMIVFFDYENQQWLI